MGQSVQEMLKNFSDLKYKTGSSRIRVEQIEQVHHRAREVLRLIALGYANNEIAQMLGISQYTVSAIKNSPISQVHLQQLAEKRDNITVGVRRDLDSLSEKAVTLYKKVLNNEVEASIGQQIKVADAVLDRTGFAKVTSVQNLDKNGLTVEQIEAIKAASEQEAYSTPIDVTPNDASETQEDGQLFLPGIFETGENA